MGICACRGKYSVGRFLLGGVMICVNLLVEDGWVQQRQGASALFGGGLCGLL